MIMFIKQHCKLHACKNLCKHCNSFHFNSKNLREQKMLLLMYKLWHFSPLNYGTICIALDNSPDVTKCSESTPWFWVKVAKILQLTPTNAVNWFVHRGMRALSKYKHVRNLHHSCLSASLCSPKMMTVWCQCKRSMVLLYGTMVFHMST